MKIRLLSSAVILAAILAPMKTEAAPATGDTFVCKSPLIANTCNNGTSYAVTSSTTQVAIAGTSYRSVQWIGTAAGCPSSHNGDCTFTVGSTTSVATQWKIGIKASGTAQIPNVASVTAEINGEFQRTDTDSEVLSYTEDVAPGYTLVPYLYVQRQQYLRKYYGVWVKGPKRGCGAFKLYACYTYTYDANKLSYSVYYYRALESFQTKTYKIFKTSNGSGLVLENDD